MPPADDHGGNLRIVHQERGFRLRELWRGWKGYQPGRERSEIREHVVGLVPHADHHPRAGCEPEPQQPGRNAAHRALRFRVGQARDGIVLADHDERGLVSARRGVLGEAVAGRVETGRRCPVVRLGHAEARCHLARMCPRAEDRVKNRTRFAPKARVMITRRLLLAGTGAALSAPAFAQTSFAGLTAEWARIEKESGGRLGVALLNTGSGARAGHRADERFPLCSTFKVLAAAAVLARVDSGREHLERRLPIRTEDLVAYSPVTSAHVGTEGLTLAELCEAAITRSDNTAGNLLLRAIGGPPGLTEHARTLGDGLTRLDRWETALNEALPGDSRDTTTPAAMLENLNRLVLGTALLAASRAHLTGWLIANKTGDARLRAGLPKDWRVGDKTGTGDRGTANDVAVIWPKRGGPVVVTVYLTGAIISDELRNAIIADVARSIAAVL